MATLDELGPVRDVWDVLQYVYTALLNPQGGNTSDPSGLEIKIMLYFDRFFIHALSFHQPSGDCKKLSIYSHHD
jgi:hypothetical protein